MQHSTPMGFFHPRSAANDSEQWPHHRMERLKTIAGRVPKLAALVNSHFLLFLLFLLLRPGLFMYAATLSRFQRSCHCILQLYAHAYMLLCACTPSHCRCNARLAAPCIQTLPPVCFPLASVLSCSLLFFVCRLLQCIAHQLPIYLLQSR